MSCSSCHTSPCNCSKKSNCQIIISDDVKYTGTNFTCTEDPTITVQNGTKLSAIILLIFQKLCSLYNSITALATTVSTMLQGHIIEDEGIPLTQRDTMNFVGDGVTVTDAGGKTVVTITGSVGPTGADGLSFREGVGVPGGGLGNDGDTYVDLASPNLDLYTKAGGVWTDTTLDLKGATGAAGANGSNGSNGTNGTNGLNVYQSAGAPLVGSGVDGETHIDSITGDLYQKVAGVWVVTGNIYTGALVGTTGLFNASRTSDLGFAVSSLGNVSFPITNGSGNYNYGLKWLTDEWVSPDTLNTILKGEIIVGCDGTGAAAVRDIEMLVYKNGVLQSTTVIGGMNESIVATTTFIALCPTVAVVADDRINVRFNMSLNNTKFTLKAGSFIFNEFN